MLTTRVVLAKRTDMNEEWRVLFPEPSDELESLYRSISLDARMNPSASGESMSVFMRGLYLTMSHIPSKGNLCSRVLGVT